jgi:hypothetical protein
METPAFPITFYWLSTGEVEVFESIMDIECNVEHFDSDERAAEVTDANGRPVRLRVSLLSMEIFELATPTRWGIKGV